MTVSLGFEIGDRTADQIHHWAIVPGVAVALLVLFGFTLARPMITACRAWAFGAYAGSALAVVASFFVDDRWYIAGAVLAVPVYMFAFGLIDGRYRSRLAYMEADIAAMAREFDKGWPDGN